MGKMGITKRNSEKRKFGEEKRKKEMRNSRRIEKNYVRKGGESCETQKEEK